MRAIDAYILAYPLVAWIVLAAAFVILSKSADVFVSGSVALAYRLRIPKLVVGIVLVSFATTMPELCVSLAAALRGSPEMALGNAVGSVICNPGLGLALAGLVAASPILVMPNVLRTSGIFSLGVGTLAFLAVAFDNTLSRWEGAVLVALYLGYITFLYRQHRQGKLQDGLMEAELASGLQIGTAGGMVALFGVGLAGIVLSSRFIVVSATGIALWLGIPQAVIALTLVAVGTSIPEVATCITSARKGHGDIAVGNIIGANILNICWVAGASAMANNLTLGRKEVFFMFPCMFVMVVAMLGMLWWGYRLTKLKGVALLVLYALYLGAMVIVFSPASRAPDAPAPKVAGLAAPGPASRAPAHLVFSR